MQIRRYSERVLRQQLRTAQRMAARKAEVMARFEGATTPHARSHYTKARASCEYWLHAATEIKHSLWERYGVRV